MIRSLCVPVDNSDQSNAAGELALFLGKSFGATVVGSHVYAARMHDYRFKQMEFTLPEEYRDENELERQRKIHDSLITMGLQLISDSYLDVLEKEAGARRLPLVRKTFDGKHYREIVRDIRESNYDLVVMGAVGVGAVKESLIGGVTERVVRRVRADVLVVRDLHPPTERPQAPIVVGIDGSPQSYGALEYGIELSKKAGRPLEAVAVYDPYLHYAMFNGIVDVLSEKASKVFRFKEQEALHEEIIDTGLAKIYQSHLEVAKKVAEESGVTLGITLLPGKVFEKVLGFCREKQPWLLLLGRIGVHGDEKEDDLGSNAENLLRLAPCNVLLTSRKKVPPIDLRAEESIVWTPEAKERFERVPPLVRGIARTGVLRYAIERGHSVITNKVIDEAIERFMPVGTARAMDHVARQVAVERVREEGFSTICQVCGYAAKAEAPVKCPVCGAAAEKFLTIDPKVVEAMAKAEGGAEEEEAFDGVKLRWSEEARKVLLSVKDAYLRRRAKARIEKSARMNRLSTITLHLMRPILEETVANESLTPGMPHSEPTAPATGNGGESASAPNAGFEWPPEAETRLNAVPEPFRPMARAMAEQVASSEGTRAITPEVLDRAKAAAQATLATGPLPWTEDARARLERVPAGFMREATRRHILRVAADRNATEVTLEIVEAAIGDAKDAMHEMIGTYQQGAAEAIRETFARSSEGSGALNEIPVIGQSY